MIKKLSVAYSLGENVYAILRRRTNGQIYNNTTGQAEALGTWDNARKQACAISLINREGGYYTESFPTQANTGVWDAFYFDRIGASIDLNDRLIGLDKFVNGAASLEEKSMLAAGHVAGKTVYAVIRSQNNAYIWDVGGDALEAIGTWNNSRKAECAISMTDKDGGYYTANFPSSCSVAGTYHIFYYDKLGGSVDINDRLIGRDKILWFGSAVSDEVVPTGERGKAMVNLRDLIAESDSFQAWVGAADAEQAKAFLHITAYEPEDSFERPFGLICRTETDRDEEVAVSDSIIGGDLELRFEDMIPSEYEDEPNNAELYFLNKIDAVLVDIKTLSRQPGHFAINSIDCIEGPTQIESDTAGQYVNGIRLTINWGLSP